MHSSSGNSKSVLFVCGSADFMLFSVSGFAQVTVAPAVRASMKSTCSRRSMSSGPTSSSSSAKLSICSSPEFQVSYRRGTTRTSTSVKNAKHAFFHGRRSDLRSQESRCSILDDMPGLSAAGYNLKLFSPPVYSTAGWASLAI